jgi:hypothetical protein
MDSYKLIKLYPNSPELGYIMNSNHSDYFHIKPHMFKEYWEKQDKVSEWSSHFGEVFRTGDVVHLLNTKTLKSRSITIYEDFVLPENHVVIVEGAYLDAYINSVIRFELPETGEVLGNKTLYSLLEGNKIQFSEESSLSVYLKLNNGKELKWKYFNSEQDRLSYVMNNSPLLSVTDTMDLVNEVRDECKLSNDLSNYYEKILEKILDKMVSKAEELGKSLVNQFHNPYSPD